MVSKILVENIEDINSALGLKIFFRNGLLIFDNIPFTSMRRLIGFADKTFEMAEMMKPNRLLSHLAYSYNAEAPSEFSNFEWTSGKQTYLNDKNGYVSDGVFIAIRDFTISMSWGTASIKRTNRLKPIYTVDGMETGVLIVGSRIDPTLYCPKEGYLLPINYSSKSTKAVINKTYSIQTLTSTALNIMPTCMIASLMTLCRAELITSVTCPPAQEKIIATYIAESEYIASLVHLRINGLSTLQLLAKHILGMSNREVTIAIKNTIKASASGGIPIPKEIVDIIASRAEFKSSVDEQIKKFVFNTLNSFFTVTKLDYPVISERYGKKDYHYHSANDNVTARQISKNLKKIEGVGEELTNVPMGDLISIVHEYAQSGVAPKTSMESTFSFGGLNMHINYEKNLLRFNTDGNDNLTKSAKWIATHRWQAKPRDKIIRAKTYEYIFRGSDDASRALVATYAFAIAVLFDIEYEIKVFAPTKVDRINVIRFFGSVAFNPFSLIVKDPTLLKLGTRDICMANKSETKLLEQSKRRIILVDKELEADVCMQLGDATKTQYSQLFRLSTCTPNKRYIYDFARMLTNIASMLHSNSHAATVFSEKHALDLLINRSIQI